MMTAMKWNWKNSNREDAVKTKSHLNLLSTEQLNFLLKQQSERKMANFAEHRKNSRKNIYVHVDQD
jgi:hypothetical protein